MYIYIYIYIWFDFLKVDETGQKWGLMVKSFLSLRGVHWKSGLLNPIQPPAPSPLLLGEEHAFVPLYGRSRPVLPRLNHRRGAPSLRVEVFVGQKIDGQT
jgi:hypothetical protein